MLSSLRHGGLTLARLATAPWRNHEVRIEEVCTVFGSCFGGAGWNHWTAAIRQREADPALDWRESAIYAFQKRFTPEGISDLMDPPLECRLPRFVYPWGPFVKGSEGLDPWTSRKCGPATDEFIEREFRGTMALHDKIKREGYSPWRPGNSFMSGTFLVDRAGDRRFVITQGNHRAASLAVLGWKTFAMRTSPGLILHEVREEDAPRWPWVAEGRCSLEEALRVFRFFFEERGERTRQMIGASKEPGR
jgi:hypothetical protein